MKRAPAEVGGARVVLWSAIDDRHRPTGACRHVVDGAVPAPFRGLAICEYEGGGGYFLFYCDEKWEVVTDGWHQTIDAAKAQAEFEYEGTADTWESAAGGLPTASKAETVGCESLRAALADLEEGAPIPDSEAFRRFLAALEWLLPEYLSEVYDFWCKESLDGVYPEVARKLGPRAVEILGLGILISDQTLAALHVRMGIQERIDEVKWMECRVGEETAEGLRRIPYSDDRINKEMRSIAQRSREIEWAFAIEFGSCCCAPTVRSSRDSTGPGSPETSR